VTGKWKVEEYENNISERSIRVVDEVGKVIVDNEPYYPQALDPKHAHLIAAAPALLGSLVEIRQIICDGAREGFNPLVGDWAERLYLSQSRSYAAVRAAEVQP